MKSDKMSYVGRVSIARVHQEPPLRVRLRSYTQFSDWMDVELIKLVARWHPGVVRRRIGSRERAGGAGSRKSRR